MSAHILIVDDEEIQRELLGGHLKKKGFTVFSASSGPDALIVIGKHTIDIMITDQKMPEMSGIELAGKVRRDHPNISVMILTAFGSVDDAVQAMKNGVEDYLTKPINLEELDIILSRIIDKRHLIKENEQLKEQIRKAPRFPGIVYVSEAMEEVMSKAARAAESSATVLVTGESGTGKELIARAIHEVSKRKNKPFVAVNCSAISENLIESEFFGHEKGAFTGADQRRIGKFEQADGGTLFLDEIGEVPINIQTKLLRVLQERAFERVGGNETIHVDVRIITATNRDLEEEIKKNVFRQDLFYRLNVVSIEIPPLKKRKSDIPILIEHFIRQYAREHAKPIQAITPEALDSLVKYTFPGNARELGNIIEQAVVLSRSDTITARDLPIHISTGDEKTDTGLGLDEQVAELEKTTLWKALRENAGNKSAAARVLGISERKIRYMLKKYGEAAEIE
ncbi:MAG: sigma-54-dependent Fis family transcriptional regulator [Candidatus Latescibacteria bacterium]|jgi:DNA-binding NtrC family response regulator|nr:sigma-54-dependent Fis family transcriptional regulator [Candidatus Latescibacterota bacterium]